MVDDAVLEWVPAGEHTKEDLELILRADENQPTIDRIPLLNVDHALRQGRMQLFRVRAPGKAVLLTEIRTAHGSKRLSLVRGAGQCGFQFRAIVKLLGKTAREWGCECIETVVYSTRVRDALLSCGAEIEGYVLTYASEGDDGQ